MALPSLDSSSTSSYLGQWGDLLADSLAPVDIAQLILAAVAIIVMTVMQLPCIKSSKGGRTGVGQHRTSWQTPNKARTVVKIASTSRDACQSGALANAGNVNLVAAAASGKPARAGAASRIAGGTPLPEPVKPPKATVAPLSAPSFKADTFSEQVDELQQQMTVTPESEATLQKLSAHVQKAIGEIFPNVSVTSYTASNVMSGTAFGVAVPEVDLVANVSPDDMIAQLQPLWPKITLSNLSIFKLQKCAIRSCTDVLTTSGGLKFRRSAFRGDEPKVTLLVPPSVGIHKESIPIDFSLNCVGPLQSAALLAECGQFDPRVPALILLVRRWAKDRGLCHAASGRLSPYAWTLLSIYFCQVGLEAPLVPAVERFTSTASLREQAPAQAATATTTKSEGEAVLQAGARQPEAAKSSRPAAAAAAKSSASLEAHPHHDDGGHPGGMPLERRSVGELFQAFVAFYARGFDWGAEGVCPRLARRAPVPLAMDLHIIVHPDGASEAGPSIEDPFLPARNHGASLSSAGWQRVREELQRAHQLLQAEAPLSELLEPWIPD